jgi:hypothetical protein
MLSVIFTVQCSDHKHKWKKTSHETFAFTRTHPEGLGGPSCALVTPTVCKDAEGLALSLSLVDCGAAATSGTAFIVVERLYSLRTRTKGSWGVEPAPDSARIATPAVSSRGTVADISRKRDEEISFSMFSLTKRCFFSVPAVWGGGTK